MEKSSGDAFRRFDARPTPNELAVSRLEPVTREGANVDRSIAAPPPSRRAYIVEDNAALRGIIRRVLTRAGIHVEEFGSAEAFLDGARDRPLGCVLLDVGLPGMSGLDLLPLLRGNGPPHPVIVLSGGADIPLAVNAVRAGAYEVLEKPFLSKRLLEAFDQAFQSISV